MNKVLKHGTECVTPKSTMLIERSQTQKATTLYVSLYITLWKGNAKKDRYQITGFQGLGMRKGDFLQKDTKKCLEW